MDGEGICIGVDGGGTGCRVAVVSVGGAVLGRAEGGPANAFAAPEAAAAVVADAVGVAGRAAGLDDVALRGAWLHVGLAGAVDRGRCARVEAVLGRSRVRVTDDRPTAVVGALGSRDGVVAAMGTGSFVGIRRGGTLRFFGGWGLHLSDEGSGAWLGRGLLRRCVQAADGLAAPSALTEAALARVGGDLPAAAAFAAGAAPSDWAALAPLVVAAAEAGDPQGRALMEAGAGWIGRCAAEAGAGLPLVLTGGLGPSYAPFLDAALRDRLAAPEGTPLDGAVALAREMAEEGDR